MKFLDLHFTYDALRNEIDQAIAETLESGWYLQGERTRKFEQEFAAYCGVQHALGVSNGLDALYAILAAYGIGSGDEVIVPAHTFIATWLAVGRTGATIVPVDADPATMNWDIDKVAEAITPQTRAIMPVHLYGLMVDVEPLRQLIAGTGIKIIEDAAQAHGALRNGVAAGAAGDAAAFSFYPGKNLGAFGDAGAVTTNDGQFLADVKGICNYGSKEKYMHDREGVNARIDELQAAILSQKLKKLDAWTLRRRHIAQAYTEGLGNIGGLKLPMIDGEAESHVWHLYVVRTPNRDRVIDDLKQKNIPTLIHYPVPSHKSGAYKNEFANASFPVCEEICATCISLPIGPHLSDMDVDQVIEGVRAATIQN